MRAGFNVYDADTHVNPPRKYWIVTSIPVSARAWPNSRPTGLR